MKLFSKFLWLGITMHFLSPAANAALKNQMLADCINLGSPVTTAQVQSGAPLTVSDFPCVANREIPPGGTASVLMPSAERDFTKWTSEVYPSGGGAIPLTGFYNKNGARCFDLTGNVATDACPIALRALFSFECDPDLTRVFSSVKQCVRAGRFFTYYALYQAKIITGEAPIKAVVIADSTVASPAVPSSANLDPTSVSYSKLIVFRSQSSPCKAQGILAGAPFEWIQLGTDPYGTPQCGEDPNQPTINALKTQVCQMSAQAIWLNGGDLDPSCGQGTVHVDKNMTVDGAAQKTIADCLAYAPGPVRRVTKNGVPISSGQTLTPFPGGTVTGTMSQLAFLQFYHIPAPPVGGPPDVYKCEVQVSAAANPVAITTNGNFIAPTEMEPGSLKLQALGGGGGGAFTDSNGHSGWGGDAAQPMIISAPNTVPGNVCIITIGTGGGTADISGSSGKQGGETHIDCQNGDVAIGYGGSGGSFGGSAKSEVGKDSIFGAGATTAGMCSNGIDAPETHYGSGGSSGDCRGCSSNRPGGRGANGHTLFSWKVLTWQPAPGF